MTLAKDAEKVLQRTTFFGDQLLKGPWEKRVAAHSIHRPINRRGELIASPIKQSHKTHYEVVDRIGCTVCILFLIRTASLDNPSKEFEEAIVRVNDHRAVAFPHLIPVFRNTCSRQ